MNNVIDFKQAKAEIEVNRKYRFKRAARRMVNALFNLERATKSAANKIKWAFSDSVISTEKLAGLEDKPDTMNLKQFKGYIKKGRRT